MTINDKIDLLLRMQLHAMDPDESGESSIRLYREAKAALEEKATDVPDTSGEILNEILLELGIPHHIVGYRAMVEAILAAKNDRSILDMITKRLYPHVAEKVGSTPSRVERSIRHAIEISFDRAEYETIEKYFGNTVSPRTGKPTVSEFVAMIADVVEREEKKRR